MASGITPESRRDKMSSETPTVLYSSLSDEDLLRGLYACSYHGSELIKSLCQRLESAIEGDPALLEECEELKRDVDELRGINKSLGIRLALAKAELLEVRGRHEREIFYLRETVKDAVAGLPVCI
jgi:hypothetical protein